MFDIAPRATVSSPAGGTACPNPALVISTMHSNVVIHPFIVAFVW
jgi:hypothetical protein